jgi:hypothetical protein
MCEGVNRISSSKPPIGAGREQPLDPAFFERAIHIYVAMR